ncbi:MAG: M20/M25/M40 family metallo-hydrolase, partial [Pirellulales bacterium]|nr:M20/M25/M40 family metallo-hydrolase [Pirellulales bacterium]
VMLRHEQQQNNPQSGLDGTKPSRHAFFRTKIANAVEHGAAAIIFCTSEADILKNVTHVRKRLDVAIADLEKARASMAADKAATVADLDLHRALIAKKAQEVLKWTDMMQKATDPLLAESRAGTGSGGRSVPVMHCRREVIDDIAKGSLGGTLSEIEQAIDKDLKPRSRAIGNWTASGETSVRQTRVDAKNVVGVLEGNGPLADETIVIGAHYDHLGYGGRGSLAAAHGKKAPKAIHNGADDNASGTSALIEIARRLAARKDELKRRVVFIAFTAEESGLLGSAHYVKDPLVPIDKTIAMLNFDMVGRMKDDKLVIFGTGSASEFDELLERLTKDRGLALTKNASGFGPSDQTSFYAKKIPVMHFFTGTHKDYHRPTDDTDKVNTRGIRRVVD